MNVTARPAVTSPSEREIRDQIERIVLSLAFRTSDRLKHFLTFVAGEALQGKADGLKEYSVGVHVFGRETGFDPRTDPVVRVQARRLRARLERYYRDEGQNDTILVELPKGGYAPVFSFRETAAAALLPATGTAPDNSPAVQRLVDRIADQVLERLRPYLQSARVPGPRQTDNLTARNLCKQGLYHLEQRTDESLERAAELFERAVIEDAQYSLAHSGLSDAYSMLGSYGLRPSTSMATMAMSSAATGVMLDDESAPARTSLAQAKARSHWNWLEAELDFQAANRLDPAYATNHHWYARCCLVPLGRLDEARDEVLLAHSLDPVSSIIAREVASIHYYRRDYDNALAHCDQAIELNPHFPHAYFILSLVQEKLGDFDEALAALLRGAQLAPKSPRMIASLGRAQAIAGRPEEAIKALSLLDELERTRFVSSWERAMLFLGLRDHDRFFRQLQLALQDRFFDLTLLGVDPRFDDVRGDSRFKELLQRVGIR